MDESTPTWAAHCTACAYDGDVFPTGRCSNCNSLALRARLDAVVFREIETWSLHVLDDALAASDALDRLLAEPRHLLTLAFQNNPRVELDPNRVDRVIHGYAPIRGPYRVQLREDWTVHSGITCGPADQAPGSQLQTDPTLQSWGLHRTALFRASALVVRAIDSGERPAVIAPTP